MLIIHWEKAGIQAVSLDHVFVMIPTGRASYSANVETLGTDPGLKKFQPIQFRRALAGTWPAS